MICDLRCLTCPYAECIRDKRQKEVYKRYYEKNREKRIAYQKEYNKAHREQIRERERMNRERRTNGLRDTK